MPSAKKLSDKALKSLLDQWADRYNRPDFIADDPISIPHRYSRRQDIEIAGLFAATLAWGQRRTIIKSCLRLMALMSDAPHDFILSHRPSELRRLEGFVHRTFNATDLLYFIEFLSNYYRRHDSMEDLFRVPPSDSTVERGLLRFHDAFFALPNSPHRTRKHVATPQRRSACKRINLFLRWMVRTDDRGVDFGLWKSISPAQLVCPCDLHVLRVARKLALISGKSVNWRLAIELTDRLRALDPLDPVRYDFALFGLGIDEAYGR